MTPKQFKRNFYAGFYPSFCCYCCCWETSKGNFICMFRTTQLITFMRPQPSSKFPFASSINLNLGAHYFENARHFYVYALTTCLWVQNERRKFLRLIHRF